MACFSIFFLPLMSYVTFAGRKESVADLKKEITNLHEDMNMIQTQLDDFKETGSAVHSLRAKLHSLHLILERKVSNEALVYLTSAKRTHNNFKNFSFR